MCSTFACMHFAHFPLFAPPFDGQKSTRSRVHFKLNLFAGASGGIWENGGYEQLYYIAGVIHYFDSLTSIHLVVLVACHFVCFHFQLPQALFYSVLLWLSHFPSCHSVLNCHRQIMTLSYAVYTSYSYGKRVY